MTKKQYRAFEQIIGDLPTRTEHQCAFRDRALLLLDASAVQALMGNALRAYELEGELDDHLNRM